MPEVDSQIYRLITVGGPDRVEFLQGQLTQDVSIVTGSHAAMAAWCNPKGRVIVVLRLVALDNAIGLLVPSSMTDAVIARLTMYRLRSQVEFTVSDVPPRLLDAGAGDPAALIANGIAFIDDSNTEEFTPHMLNLDKVGAISFDKRCYTGQEVVARTENLGKSKRRMMRYRAGADGIKVGDRVVDGGRNVGQVVNVAGRELLAVSPTALHDSALEVGGIAIEPLGLPYAI